MRILDYQVLDVLYESTYSKVYRVRDLASSSSFILKVLNQNYPLPEEIARYRLEYDITRRLKLNGAIRAYRLERYHNTLLMVLEDFGATSLKQLLPNLQLDLPEFLAIAIHLAETLGQIHQQRIIHKDINPSNIVMNPQTRQVKIIDFGLSSVLSQEKPTLCPPTVLEGTLAYISPEQTGRMNREVDYRTDFYSLGVTFYELLTGQLPFPILEPLELVHSHIAKQPVSLQEINSGIPLCLSNVVMKLLAKMPEDRYQNAVGLKFDLERCLHILQESNTTHTFLLGEHDICDRFVIPGKLYGREQDIKLLLEAFDRVAGVDNTGTPADQEVETHSALARSEVMLVSGYSGIGKSALVQEIYKPITRQRGYFISGKFDQFQRNVPYSALIQAFRSLIRQLLTTGESEIALWRDKLLQALGSNAQVMIEVIPELELVVGVQPPVVELPPQESQNRFNLVFQNFITVFTQREHPLVMFLDDLQWADSGALKLIQLLMGRSDSQYLLLIGAYRDNEVDASHPLRTAIAALIDMGIPTQALTLTALQRFHIQELLKDTLHNPHIESLSPLAELILEKTGGNPFFMNEFLKALYTNGLLRFSPQHQQWQWDLEQIQAAQMTDNVVELMTQNIQKLPEASQHALKLAACIGNQFELQTLAIVREKSTLEVARELWEAVQVGLILPQGKEYKLLQVADTELCTALSELNVTYRFRHDRVQQAAYSLIPLDQKHQVHLKIGQLLYHGLTPEQQEEQIFDLVNHLNQGLGLIQDDQLLCAIAQLNLNAGIKAKTATAYDQALDYLQQGINCIRHVGWKHHYPLMLALHQTAAEAAYLAGKFD